MVQLLSDKVRKTATYQVETLAQANAENSNSMILTLKAIKHSLIGNRTKKNLYVGIGLIPKIIEIIHNVSKENIPAKVQAVIVLGSLAYGSPEIVNELVEHKAIASLISCIDVKKYPLELIEAAARSLKALLQHSKVDSGLIYKEPTFKNILVLLNTKNKENGAVTLPTTHTAELAALIFAKSCDEGLRQDMLYAKGVIPLSMDLITSESVKTQEAALLLLTAITKDNEIVGSELLKYERNSINSKEILKNLGKSMNPLLQLAAISCLTNLVKSKALKDVNNEISLAILPSLVKLLDSEGPVQIETPLVLSYLVQDDEKLQKEACDADAVTKLSQVISNLSKYKDNLKNHFYYQPNDKDKFEENALVALASIGSLDEDCRFKIIEAKALPHIINAMSHPKTGVRTAACLCARSLSRSVRNLRTDLVDAGLSEPLFKLLNDEDTIVQVYAMSTICNVVLDFSPMKTNIVNNGGVEKLVDLVGSKNPELSLNAIWALKNLLFKADPTVKQNVMEKLGYKNLSDLIFNGIQTVQEQALGLLRNLSCGGDADVSELFKGLGSRNLIHLLEEKLKIDHAQIKIQTLYCIVNISTGTNEHKSAIMDSYLILSNIKQSLSNKSHLVRVAAVWCLINLSWIDDLQEECYARIRTLKSMGFEKPLTNLLEDERLDVQDRARTALSHFKAESQHQYGPRSSLFESDRRFLTRAYYDQHGEGNNDR